VVLLPSIFTSSLVRSRSSLQGKRRQACAAAPWPDGKPQHAAWKQRATISQQDGGGLLAAATAAAATALLATGV